MNDESGDQYGVAVDDDSGLSTDENPDLLAPDINHHEPAAGEPQGNETSDNETGDDIYAPDVSNTVPVSEDLNMTNQTGNATDNATSSATSPQTMLATGNPILALLAVGAVLGGAAIIKRK